MNPLQTANDVIEKLQEENRIALDTLRQSENQVNLLEREITKKDQIIRILQEKLRSGSNGYLESLNREKSITIKHLELQIEKLMKENKDLLSKTNTTPKSYFSKTDGKDNRNLFENRPSKPFVKKPTPSQGNNGSGKCSCENSEKLIRIIEHKDNRIDHLSKEVHKLASIEKELTNKVYRLTKLMPLSHAPPQEIIDCLLREVQSLEKQLQLGSKENLHPSQSKLHLKGTSILPPGVTSSKMFPNPIDSMLDNTGTSRHSDPSESRTLKSNLLKLLDDISKLRCQFCVDNDKIHQTLTDTSSKKNLLKMQWSDIVQRLNKIADGIESLIHSNPPSQSQESDKDFAILQLQDRLKDSLDLVTQYEKENSDLKEQLYQREQEGGTRSNSYQSEEVEHLKTLLKTKQQQLEASERHLVTCRNFIEELQKKYQRATNDQSTKSTSHLQSQLSNFQQEKETWQKRLDVAEKGIKSSNTMIEKSQTRIKQLEEENKKLQNESSNLRQKTSSIDSLTAKLRAKEEDLNSALNTIAKLEDTLKQIRTDYEQMEAAMEQMQTHLAEQRTMSEDLKNHNHQLETEVRSARSLQMQEQDIASLKEELASREATIKTLQESVEAFQKKACEMNHYRRTLRKDIEKLCSVLQQDSAASDSLGSNVSRGAVYKAAVLRTAQSLLQLDDRLAEQTPDCMRRENALEELKHQVQVYLTEVARINELLTLKEQEREEMLKNYMDLNFPNTSDLEEPVGRTSGVETLNPSFHEQMPNGTGPTSNGRNNARDNDRDLHAVTSKSRTRSDPLLPTSRSRDEPPTTSRDDVQYRQKNGVSKSKQRMSSGEATSSSAEESPPEKTRNRLPQNQPDANKDGEKADSAAGSDTITNYLLTRCNDLEEALEKQQVDVACRQLEKDEMQAQLRQLQEEVAEKRTLIDQVNALMDMRYQDSRQLQQLRCEMQHLQHSKQQMEDDVSSTNSELNKVREENTRMRRDLDRLSRDLVDEKFQHAKLTRQLKMFNQSPVDSSS